MTTRRKVGLVLFGLGLAAGLGGCGQAGQSGVQSARPRAGSLEWAAAGDWRIDPEHDRYRHPVQTFEFFGLQPDMTVVEVMPGRGWHTSIIAPYLAAGGGRLIAASFDPAGATDAQLATQAEFRDRFMQNPRLFGTIEVTPLSPRTNEIAPPASADMVLAMLTVRTLMAENYAHQAFRQFAAALKPGGVLGVVENRARSSGANTVQDPQAADGYVQEQFVKMMAAEAGLNFAGSSEINANPNDTKDHPFGAWTLPPYLFTAPLGAEPDPAFDRAKYEAIGEPDRMTLKFIKPADGANSAAP